LKKREYYENNKADILEKKKLYRFENKQIWRNYFLKNKEKISKRKREQKKTIICLQCGNSAEVHKYENQKFCSLSCSSKWHNGPRSCHWKGGRSFGSYCPKSIINLRKV
jgi:hypothetical protein